MIEGTNLVEFEWNEEKAEVNLVKHGIAFEETDTIFDDLYARVIPDPAHSAEEVRIISARKATKQEARQYWRYVDA